MITPTYAPIPRLALDFTSGVLDSRVTITRALNTATRVNSSGYIETVNANLPRFDYDPTTLAARGLLIEETRANALTYSNEFSNATAWFKGLVTVTPDTVISPDGTQNADTLFFPASANANLQLVTPIAVTAGQSYTATVYIRADAPISNVKLTFATYGDLTTPAITTTWQRFTVTVTATGATLSTVLVTRNSVATTIYIYGFQLETGAFATSYIPTTTTALTRNADVAVITGANFSDWWQSTRGGAQVQAIASTVSGIRPLVQYDDGTANEIISLRGNTTNPELYIVDGGAPQAQLDAGTIAANTAYSLTGWWNTNDCKARKDAGVVVIDTTATIPTVTQARLGSDGTNYLNGTLATINYYDKFSGQIYTRRKNKAVFSLL